MCEPLRFLTKLCTEYCMQHRALQSCGCRTDPPPPRLCDILLPGEVETPGIPSASPLLQSVAPAPSVTPGQKILSLKTLSLKMLKHLLPQAMPPTSASSPTLPAPGFWGWHEFYRMRVTVTYKTPNLPASQQSILQ